MSAPPCLLQTPRLTENDAHPSMEHTFCNFPDGSFLCVESPSSDEAVEETEGDLFFLDSKLSNDGGSRDRAVDRSDGVSSARVPTVGDFIGEAAFMAWSKASIALTLNVTSTHEF